MPSEWKDKLFLIKETSQWKPNAGVSNKVASEYKADDPSMFPTCSLLSCVVKQEWEMLLFLILYLFICFEILYLVSNSYFRSSWNNPELDKNPACLNQVSSSISSLLFKSSLRVWTYMTFLQTHKPMFVIQCSPQQTYLTYFHFHEWSAVTYVRLQTFWCTFYTAADVNGHLWLLITIRPFLASFFQHAKCRYSWLKCHILVYYSLINIKSHLDYSLTLWNEYEQWSCDLKLVVVLWSFKVLKSRKQSRTATVCMGLPVVSIR